MKKLTLLVISMLMGCNSSQKTVKETAENNNESEATVYAKTITEEDLKTHLYTYASDEFEGRETGKPGQKKAAEYLKTTYETLNIPAAKKDGDYFQTVPLEISSVPKGSITINGNEHEIGNNFATFSVAKGNYSDIVYAGYGVAEDTYSDYKDIDVTNKIVLVKQGEPKNEDGTYVLSGNNTKSKWSNLSESFDKRVQAATANGAKGILFYDSSNFERYKNYYNIAKNNNRGKMALKNNATSFLSFIINAELAEELLPSIEKDSKHKVLNTSLDLNIKSGSEEISSENVIAVIKGSEKPEEYVIISSHLDHIGVNANGDINNGADDDGSGTVALLEIAQAFKKAKDEGNGPKRSVVFLHVTGEEKGLLGSQYYSDIEPIFPLSQTVSNLNIDMIGRIDPKRNGDRNYIYLIGSDKLSMDLHNLSEEVNEKYTQIELDYKYNDENDPNRFYYRSDHYNFAKNNIPIIFYFNGTHADYHKPGDTPDKINYDLLMNRTQLVFYTAWEVANREQRIIVD